ncbi:hypothetical protein E2562_037278 [Oryza meyeriana var. granulata]|uniref:Retroviral polymerase SH3-like domain-containing protein n=1 Tax=Oryza meyeriana var. granulata TaxID=110450 RepID=A0A6G1C199_9ORYZ|nr:hypothetical protein E2562_037278 [Oryza meyeriana var. granulata]
MVFIGYEHGSKAYRMYDPVVRRVCVPRDVVFNETAMWPWHDPKDEQAPGDEEFTMEYYVTPIAGGHAPSTMEEDGNTRRAVLAPSSPVVPAETTTASAMESAMPTSSVVAGVEFCTPLTDASAGTDEAPHRYRTVADTLTTTSPILNFDYGDECLMVVEEPANFVEAEKQGCWQKAMISLEVLVAHPDSRCGMAQ